MTDNTEVTKKVHALPHGDELLERNNNTYIT